MLENYALHFDHAPGTGQDDKFEISGAAYRLLRSACFLKSNGALLHHLPGNPHGGPGEAVIAQYTKVCQNCHADAHKPSENCISCHMPKRRTDDVVHAVMTDHFIQRRRPSRDLLAPLPETHDSDRTAYRGEVALLYPRHLPATGDSELYLATAQVTDGAILEFGIPRLRKAIETYRPPQAQFYFELANAYTKTNQDKESIPFSRRRCAGIRSFRRRDEVMRKRSLISAA